MLAMIVAIMQSGFALALTASADTLQAARLSKAGAYVVAASEVTWRDDVRNRDVPVRIYTPVAEDAPKDARFPVILFSHGLGGNRAGGKLWA
jgi:predicted dienelactone hydrolase